MRALLLKKLGSLDALQLEQRPTPRPKAGEVLIDVRAVGLNFPDLLVIRGLYQRQPPLPFAPGKEVAGVVAESGPGIAGIKPGDRVMAQLENGAYAEQAVAPAVNVYPIPDAMSFPVAAAMGLVSITAHLALFERGLCRPGETVLVTGASGGVGEAAVQLAKAKGARVLAGVTSREKGEAAKAMGADHAIDLAAPEIRDSLRAQVWAVTEKRGADVVIEQVGGDVFDGAIRALAWCGRLVVVGFAGGRIPDVRANYLLLKNIAVTGLQSSDYRDRAPERLRAVVADILGLFQAGRLKPPKVTAFPLERFREALDALDRRSIPGRLVLTTGRTAAR